LSAAELAAQGAAREAEEKAEAQRKRKEGLTLLLHTAANSGNRTAVDEALAKGANINATDAGGEGWTVMYDVAGNCNTQSAVDMAKYLILKGANVDQADVRGRTPLYHAARYNGTECVREFLKVAKNLNTRDGDGVTAVTRAIWKGHADIAKMIYDAGVAKGDQQVMEHADTHGKTSEHPHIRRLFGGVEQAPKQASTFASTPVTPEKPKEL
jgi:ankyrin repeat protein